MMYVFWDSFELSNTLVEPKALFDLTDFEARRLKWISASDFVEVAWSTKRAAEAFNVNEKEVYEALASLTVKAKDYIQIFYDGGSIRIVADY